MTASTSARSQDAVQQLSDSITSKHLVLREFPADARISYSLKQDQLTSNPSRLHAFADFVPEKIQIKKHKLTIEGESRVFVHNPEDGKIGVAAPVRRIVLAIDLADPSPDTFLPQLPVLLFYPDLMTALKELPEVIRIHTVNGSFGSSKATVPAVSRVSPPKLLKAADPKYSDEAREKKVNGSCEYAFEVGPNGVTNVWLTKPLGYGLDESGEAALEQYRFKPATKDGAPVSVWIFLSVNFAIT